MGKKIENGLIVVKEDVFTKIRRNLFAVFFKKEARLLEMLAEIERPKNVITGKIIIPKEMGKLKKIIL